MGACGSTPKVLKDDALLAPEIEKEPEQDQVAEKDIIVEAKQPKIEPSDSLKDSVEVVDELDNKVEGDHESNKGKENNVIEMLEANTKNEDNKDEKNATTNDIDTIPSEPVAEVEQPHSELIKEAVESKHENASEEDQEKASQTPAVEQKITTSDDNDKVADVVVDVPKIEESNIVETSAPKNNGFPDIGNRFRSLVSNVTKGLNNNKNK